jgi:hypothetical protein
MAKTTRSRSKALIEQAGLTTKDFQGTWHRARDFNAADLQKEINHIKRTGKPSIQKAPSDVARGKREEYRKTFEPKAPRRTGITLEPPPRAPAPPPQIPDGHVAVFWKDITKRGKNSRYPNALKELKSLKAAMRGQDPEAIRGYIKEILKDNEGKIGDIEIRIYRTPEQLKELKKEFRGWTIIYNGKGASQKDLLIGLAAVVTGVYNLSLSKMMAQNFIDQIKKIHPTNGQWLDETYRSIT